MKAMNKAVLVVACTALLTFVPGTASADRDRDYRSYRSEHGSGHRSEQKSSRWHGDIRHFHDRDLRHWRRGHWHHGVHGGRYGWWWVIPTLGIWYAYNVPVYPYPDPYVPPTAVRPPPPPPPPQYWYYCPSRGFYYPYVDLCPGGWRKVPAR